MAIIQIRREVMTVHPQITNVLKQEFPDLERMPPTRTHEIFKTLISRQKAIIPLFHYQKGKLYLKHLL
jgi:hypothetical protein